MASASMSSLVIFIAAVSIAASVSGVMVHTVGDIADSLDEQGADLASNIDTDIEIISDPGSGAVYDNGTSEVRILAKNTGERTLATDGSAIEILVDGQYVSSANHTVTVLDGNEWADGNVVRVVVDESLSSGDHRVTVVVRGERETLQFRT